ncbi:unnamed protein product [Knipowitschia caucasica]
MVLVRGAAEMEDQLEDFLKNQKARVAEDRASLQEPPYMVMSRPQRSCTSTVKENIPPPPAAEEEGAGLPLGLDYEKKKQRLQRELRLDYRHYITQKSQRDLEPLSLCNRTRVFKSALVPQRPPSCRDVSTLTENSRGQERADPQEGAEEDQVHQQGRCWNTRSDTRSDTRREVLFGRRSKAAVRRSPEEVCTGLIIGAALTEEVLQKKKERYRRDLQEQMAEKDRSKRRERELQLQTPEEDPLRPVGNQRHQRQQRYKDVAVETDFPLAPVDKAVPAPQRPPVAFQSPVLDYSSALYQGNQNPALYPSNPPRIQLLPPSVPEVYTGPPHHHHYYSRTLHPHTPYYPGHLPYWDLPPGGAASSHYGDRSPQSHRSESSFPPVHPDLTSSEHLLPLDKSRLARERVQSYRDALQKQIQEQQERRRQEQEEAQRYEAQLEEEMRRHQPWGRGGGGAPLKDSTGNVIADLKRLCRLSEDMRSPPNLKGALRRESDPCERVNGTVSVCSDPDTSGVLHGFTQVQSPQFARGSVFPTQPSVQQLQEQDKYKAFLRLQMDEKQRLKAEERERQRLEEEKEEKRLSEQRARIQQEFEEEQERKRRKEQEQRAKNEELIRLAEQRKREAERKRREEEEKQKEALRRLERERQTRTTEADILREASPPIPTLQKKLLSPHPPTVESSICPMSTSPPVPARRNQLRAAEERDVFSELSALRRHLRTQQRRLQHERDLDLLSPMSDREGERPLVDVFDRARLRLQAVVHRGSSREPKNLRQIHHSLQLQDHDQSRPSSDVTNSDIWRNQSQRSSAQDDYLDLPPTGHSRYLRSALGGGSRRCSLLESEGAFRDPLSDATPELRDPPLSARERRRRSRAQTGASSTREEAQSGSSLSGKNKAAVGSDEDSDPPPPQRNRWRRPTLPSQPIRREHLAL